MENITDSYYNHAKIICNEFEIKYFSKECHDLYLKSDMLLAEGFLKTLGKCAQNKAYYGLC